MISICDIKVLMLTYIYLFHIVKQDNCESFNPLITEHMAAIGDDATTFAQLLALRMYQILVM